MTYTLIVSASEAFSAYSQYGYLVRYQVIFSNFINCIEYCLQIHNLKLNVYISTHRKFISHEIMMAYFQQGPLIKIKYFQEEVLKFFVVLWRYMVFQFLIRSACLFEQIYPVLTNVQRGPRSNFWDHSQLFRPNGGVIEPNRTIFWAKCCIFRPIYYIFIDDILFQQCFHSINKRY